VGREDVGEEGVDLTTEVVEWREYPGTHLDAACVSVSLRACGRGFIEH
jgi:hypothetical protein